VTNPERHALLEKAANRILGTVIGCVAGYYLGLCIEGRPVLQTVAMFVIAAIGVYGRFRSVHSYAWIIGAVGGLAILSMSLSTSRWAYVGTQGGVAFILTLVTGIGPPDTIMPAVSRIAGMLCGVGILLFVCFVFGHTAGSRSATQRETKAAN
jgi:uncharacterized membrane protein YccC